jgi:RNAse (barnase) inhibitor barstar
MLVRLDARQLADPAALHAALAAALGLPPAHGANLDALVDSLTHLDDPRTPTARVQSLPGELTVFHIEHADGAPAVVRALADVVAFANYRRLETGRGPVAAVAYDRG